MKPVQLAIQLLGLRSYVHDSQATAGDRALFDTAALVKGAGAWNGSVYTPLAYKEVAHRRALICVWGEVFWQSLYSERCDVVVSRARHRLPATARLVHYTQYKLYKDRFEARAYPKTKGCAFMTSYVTKYSGAESLARWALFALAAKRYGCEFIGDVNVLEAAGLRQHAGRHCQLSWHLCFKDYRVGLVGENSIHEGYVTEKLALPQLMGAMPLYVGAPDVLMYSSDLVQCSVSGTSLTALRKLATGRRWHVEATKAELVRFATILLAADFEPCLDRIQTYLAAPFHRAASLVSQAAD